MLDIDMVFISQPLLVPNLKFVHISREATTFVMATPDNSRRFKMAKHLSPSAQQFADPSLQLDLISKLKSCLIFLSSPSPSLEGLTLNIYVVSVTSVHHPIRNLIKEREEKHHACFPASHGWKTETEKAGRREEGEEGCCFGGSCSSSSLADRAAACLAWFWAGWPAAGLTV